jgi:ADP-ribosylglycohydrolase
MTTKSKTLIGAIAGDVIGSVYEWDNIKTADFPLFSPDCRFTDDTVLTVAVADCILNGKDFTQTLWNYGRRYRNAGYGGRFGGWLNSGNPQPYESFGNGSAMRVSAAGFAARNLEEALALAKQTAKVTHNHPEGIKGAQATVAAVFLAWTGSSKQEIRDYISRTFDDDLCFTLDGIRTDYSFDVTCQGSVPQAIVAFLENADYENAISIGGDSDTITCITGGIAIAFYREIPQTIIEPVRRSLWRCWMDLRRNMENFENLFK